MGCGSSKTDERRNIHCEATQPPEGKNTQVVQKVGRTNSQNVSIKNFSVYLSLGPIFPKMLHCIV